MLYNIIIIILGLFISLVLFHRFPLIEKSTDNKYIYKVSIIIPARNEEKNIGLLLSDLKKQTYSIHEIICVDDCSDDRTADIISSYRTRLISVKDKPDGWTGKSWACMKGADSAEGDIYLFLDADVRLNPDAVSSLVSAFNKNKTTISVLPYHKTQEKYEQFSLFFNIIQLGANGIGTPFKTANAGLYGPVILIPAETYRAIGGHTSVKSSIVDDIALGEKLVLMGYDYKLFLGHDLINYRMYSKGFRELIQGWTKNYATGAVKTPFHIFIMVFLWITSCILTFSSLFELFNLINIFYIITMTVLYIFWFFELYRISHKLGSFSKTTLVLFPVYLMFFVFVFINSLIKKVFHMQVIWKNRKIKLE